MTFILNEYDVENAVRLAVEEGMPVAERGARILRNLVDMTNRNSDGWPYFKKPAAAAGPLQTVLHVRFYSAYDKRVKEDLTEQDLTRALRPIKAFVTKQGWSHDELMAYV